MNKIINKKIIGKKGIQLAASYVVLIVIMIIIIILGFNFVRTGLEGAQKGVEIIEENQLKLIQEDLLASSTKVSLPVSQIKGKAREIYSFPLGIKNDLGRELDFEIFILFDNAIDSEGNNFVPSNIDEWTTNKAISFSLKDLEAKVFNPSIFTSGAKKGTYTFSVIVKCNLDPKVCDPYAHRKITISVD